MFDRFRDQLSLLVSNIQIKWMEQYGYFDEDGMYIFEKDAPMWVYNGQRNLGKLSMFLAPSYIKDNS